MRFEELTERQLLALAISLEEEDGRIYRDFAEAFRADYTASAELFTRLADEESQHRHRLLDLYRARFGEHVPLLRRQDVRGFRVRRPVWLGRALSPERARREAAMTRRTVPIPVSSGRLRSSNTTSTAQSSLVSTCTASCTVTTVVNAKAGGCSSRSISITSRASPGLSSTTSA